MKNLFKDWKKLANILLDNYDNPTLFFIYSMYKISKEQKISFPAWLCIRAIVKKIGKEYNIK